MRALGLLGVGVLLWSQAASADGPIPCTCRAQGTSFALGAVVCLKTPEGPRLARCERVLNNTSWTPLEMPCPTARTGPTVVAGLAAAPD
jgi:hypothetical protein